MSHTATVSISFSNKELLKKTCENLGLQYIEKDHRISFYDKSINAKFSIQLPGWQYPVVIHDDEINYDNYNGRWGKIEELEKLQNHYSRMVVIQEAENNGWMVEEEATESGEIILNLYDYS